MTRLKLCIVCFFCLVYVSAYGKEVVNVYAWAGEIPKELIQEFEKETQIQVNFTSFDSNETLYAKLRTTPSALYDVVSPSSYYVEKMTRQGLLTPLDTQRLPNLTNIDPFFLDLNDDKKVHYAIPLVWGTTGVFINTRFIKQPVDSWSQFWSLQTDNQLLLLDDPREVFSMALLSSNLSANSQSAKDIKKAYAKLSALMPHVKLFSSDTVKSIMIDEDAVIGMAWNGDFFKAHQENKHLKFIYPKEGFILWQDCLSILKNAPHKKNAYRFINFMLRAQSAKLIALKQGHAITNRAGRQLLPDNIRNNLILYPTPKTLARAIKQQAIAQDSLDLYLHYWQALKFSA